MTGAEYQMYAQRTMPTNYSNEELEMHALHGMVGEIGEIHSIYQKRYQGHNEESDEHRKKELGDLLWFIAEYCNACKWNLDEIMLMNVEKLIARYPDGFDLERSINREDGDV